MMNFAFDDRYLNNVNYGFSDNKSIKIDVFSPSNLADFDLHRFDADGFSIPLNNLILFNLFDYNIRIIQIILIIYQYKLLLLLSKCFLKKLIKNFNKSDLDFRLENDVLNRQNIFLKDGNGTINKIPITSLWFIFTIKQKYNAVIFLEYDRKLPNFITDFSEITINFLCYRHWTNINQAKKFIRTADTCSILNYMNLNKKFISDHYNNYYDNCIEIIKMVMLEK